MQNTEVKEKIEQIIQEVAQRHDLNLPNLSGGHDIIDDLGFTSLSVVALFSNLEETFDIDPFENDDIIIGDIKTIEDLCEIYVQGLGQKS